MPIEATGLSRIRDGRVLVGPLDLAVEKGEVLGLLGPNGAGKSTLLALLAGALAPTTGTVRIAGVDLVHCPQQAKRLLGYLPEEPPLYPEMTVDAYLTFAGRLRGLSGRGLSEACVRVKGLCGLHEEGRRAVGHLSKGFRQRVGIAQAVLHRPAVVLLDEPTVALDLPTVAAIRHLIAEIGRESAVVFSTHYLADVEAVCQRVVILDGGLAVLDIPVNAPEGTVFDLALAHPPQASLIGQAQGGLAGVLAVEPTGEHAFRITVDPAQTTVESLASQVAARGWGLQGISPARPRLQETFLRIAGGG